jgi:predicted PurR-regulated permease PerM
METSNRPININLTTSTVVKTILLLILIYFISIIKDILILLFVALILSSAFDPWVDWFQGKKIPRGIGILIIYLICFLVLGTALYLIIPPIIKEASALAANFPQYFEKILSAFSSLKQYSLEHGILDNIQDSLGTISSNLQIAAGSVFSTITGIFGGIVSFFLVIVMTFYMVVEENSIKNLVRTLVPRHRQIYAMHLINRMQIKLGLWLRGQLILSFSIFLITFSVLFFLGINYALILALIAGITEMVPYLGPILGAVPAIFLAFTQSPVLALIVAAAYYGIQLIENNFLVPKVMEKTVGLNPIISISALLIGFNIAGIVGAILSIPVATALSVFIKDVFKKKEAEEAKNV